MNLAAKKSWTLEEAEEAQRRAERVDSNLVRGPLFQWVTLHELDELEQQFQAGDSFALMQAICACALDDLPLPNWVAKGYLNGYYRVVNCRARSWDDAFGAPYPKGFHIDQARLRREKGPAVFVRVRRIKNEQPDIAIDGHLFERVGRDLGIGKTLASELYYSWASLLPRKS